jgi:hypothetical protein
MQIDISEINKAELLKALYDHSQPQGMGILHYDPRPMTLEEADELTSGDDVCLYFDYLKGRVMKVDISGDTLDTWGYDRDNGEGAAAAAIKHLL